MIEFEVVGMLSLDVTTFIIVNVNYISSTAPPTYVK